MDTEKLKQDINVILTAEAETQTIEWIEEREVGGRYSMLPGLTPEQTLADDLASNHRLQSQNYTLLRALFDRIANDEERSVFIDQIEKACRDHPAATLAFLFLLKQRRLKDTIKLLQPGMIVAAGQLDRGRHLQSNAQMQCFEFLKKYLQYEHNSLSEDEIIYFDRLAQHVENIKGPKYIEMPDQRRIIEDLPNAFEIAYARRIAGDIKCIINKIRHSRIEKDLLEGVNLEINQDRDTVKHYLEQFGFPFELIENIRNVEEAYQSAQSGFDYKTCADHLRSFISGLTKEIADKVAQHDADTRQKEPAKYLHDRGFFNSTQESNLFQSFMDYLSSDSVHQLSSDREVARIGKNVAIEFALLLSQRLENYLAENADKTHASEAATSSS